MSNNVRCGFDSVVLFCIPTWLLQNSEWIVAVAAAVLVIVGFVLIRASSRKVSRLDKKVAKLAREVDELRGLEERRLLKELKSEHKQSAEIEAPPLAPFRSQSRH